MIKRMCSGFLCMKNMKLIAVISIFALVLLNTAYGAETSPTNRPAHWAKPIQMEGVPNLHKVSDTLYRSAQPSAEGMKRLKAMGIETVVNLRSFHSDRDQIGDTGLAYEHIYMKTWHPEEEEAIRFLQIVTNPKRSPVLVHCQHGADRTGTMCALYRVAVQSWSKEEALKEMTQGGFGFHGIWENLIQWINGLDIDRIKKKAGIR
jgi:protein tyrosine/serine phosphatase